MTNSDVARQLQQHARKLAERYGNLYRIRAYRRAAHAVLGLERPVTELQKWELEILPGIGDHLALAITNYVRTGEWKTYEELTSTSLAV
jgi:DNA polymerase/3'-5' exonuclease PolX